MKISLAVITVLFVLIATSLRAQDNNETEEILPIEVFRTQRLVNGHTLEPVYKGQMVLTFSHRFVEPLTRGVKHFFGLDDYADIRFAFAYGVTDRLSVEVGRTRTNKVYDALMKYKVLQQKPGEMPVSVGLLFSAAAMTDDFPNEQAAALDFRHRARYLSQLMVARQFGERLGAQATAVWTHHNLAQKRGENSDTYLLGAGGRVKLTRVTHFSVEYFQPLNNLRREERNLAPVIGIGFDFITPRHAFQVTLGNNRFLLDTEFLTQTTQDLFNHRGLLLGFHITRNFF